MEALYCLCMDAAIVIAVFNQVEYTQKCLDSLREAGVPDTRIYVVDNASTDDTPALLTARPKLNVIRNQTNRGCGGAWSQGARAAVPATWTVVLNNDVLVPRGWLEGLTGFGEQERFDVVGPAMCEGEQDYDFASHAAQFMAKMAGVKRCGVGSGVCFTVHRRVFDAVGFLDEDPRLGGYEDDEFFRRCRRNGFRLALTGRSFLHHFGSMTQKAIKAGLKQPKASLGDRAYYRKKYGLTWFKRQQSRWNSRLAGAKWRLSERARFGCTLISRREGGVFIWR
jgi:N-acetylglucosaminyl-diphospho-decaprenol L-rhamnosyltransferase